MMGRNVCNLCDLVSTLFEFRHARADTFGMPLSMLTVKSDCMPHVQLQFLEVWEAWGIDPQQQLEWFLEIFGPEALYNAVHYLSLDSALLEKKS